MVILSEVIDPSADLPAVLPSRNAPHGVHIAKWRSYELASAAVFGNAAKSISTICGNASTRLSTASGFRPASWGSKAGSGAISANIDRHSRLHGRVDMRRTP